MKTIPIRTGKKTSVQQKFKTISPPSPHVNLAIKHKLITVNQKPKKLRKHEAVAKVANTEIRSEIADTANVPILDKTTPAPISITATATTTSSVLPSVSPTNQQHSPTKSATKGHSYISWPQQLKRKKTYVAATDLSDNETPFDSDELATFDEFESIAKLNNNPKSHSQHSSKNQTVTRSSLPKTRRRQIDPTTCERDYSSEEVEFMNAIDEYKRSSGRMFPTCSEILEVLKNLGYEKREKICDLVI
jgi:hypothetical protein